VFRLDEIADLAADALRGRAEELDAERAVHGLDALPEIDLHPILAGALEGAGYAVHREQLYPAQSTRRRRSERERCDLVLTRGEGELLDPRDGARQADAASLFTQRAVAPDDACWIEVKSVGQFTYEAGVPQPNRTYSSELVAGPIGDLAKLARDPFIATGAVLVVLFTADEPVARHDLGVLMHRCLDKELPVGSPMIRSFPITDRIGNARCSVALIPVSGVVG
jgi:hypothetical protein